MNVYQVTNKEKNNQVTDIIKKIQNAKSEKNHVYYIDGEKI